MRINTNVSALNTQRILGQTGAEASKLMGRLSSGFRINNAADDAAGLGIANTLRANVRTLQQASRNADQATALLQVAEGATSTIGNILDRMKELAAQAASSNSGDRNALHSEFDTLRTEITRTVNTTKYQGNALIDGSMGTYYDAADGNTTIDTNLQVQGSTIKAAGAKADTYTIAVKDGTHLTATDGSGNVDVATVAATGEQNVSFARFGLSFATTSSFNTGGGSAFASSDLVVADGTDPAQFLVSSSKDYQNQDLVTLGSQIKLDTTTLGIAGSSLATQAGAQTTLADLDTAIGKVQDALSTIGATQNRIAFASDNVKTTIQNFSAAESTIRDADMAEEMSNFSKTQILQQAGVAMLAQANQAPQLVLKLLG